MSNTKRKFSLDDDFMNFKTNDLLYGFMRSLSTAEPTGEKNEKGKMIYQEYLPIKTFKKNRKLIASICNCTVGTINNQVNKMIEEGLIEEGVAIGKTDKKDYEYDSYRFPAAEKEKNFKIIDCELVRYLVDTRNSQAIRIFLYLLSKYQWKKDYIFTRDEIREALGYSPSTTSCYSLINNCLASFKAEGLIDFDVVEVEVPGAKDLRGKTYKMKLKYVCGSSAELPARSFK